MQVTERDPESGTSVAANAGDRTRLPPTAGALLQRARAAAGLSLDAVAQQLKLAPRQVKALEDDNFAGLPGRTFVRGFVRNYARLLRIDPEIVLSALPGGDTHSLDSPALQATAPTIGELPTAERAKPGWARWVIPLALVAIIATAAIYEFSRDYGGLRRIAPAPPGASDAERSAAAPQSPASATGTPLPNPVAAPPTSNPPAANEPVPGAAQGATAASAVPLRVAPAMADATVVLTFRDSSWTEVKDSSGRVLVSQMIAAGQTLPVSGTPPFDLVIGNATEVSVTFQGKAIDLAPYTRQNVARFVLP